MSRSVKKHCGGKITTARSDKDDKRIWHGSVRAMKRSWICEVCKADDTDEVRAMPTEWDSSWSDTWNWGSDGGSYLMETEQNVRDMLCKLYRNAEKEVLEYKSGRVWRRSDWDMINLVAHFIKIESAEQVREFLSKNENARKVVRLWKKLNFGK